MYRQNQNVRRDTVVPLPARPNVIVMGFVLLPATIIGAIATTVTAESLATPALLVLLILVGISQVALIYLALQHFFSASLSMNSEGLTINRFANSETYAWRDVASIDVIPATGTLLDNPFCALEQRVGVGLTMRNSVQSSKEAPNADVIIAACDATHTIRMMQLAERIQQFRSSLSSTNQFSQPKKVKQANQKSQFTSRQGPSATL